MSLSIGKDLVTFTGIYSKPLPIIVIANCSVQGFI